MCARDAVGLQALTDAVADLLGTARLDPEAAQLCSARQLAAATRARDALAEAIAARQNGFGLDAAAVLYGYGSREEVAPFAPVFMAADCKELTEWILRPVDELSHS